MARKVHFAFGFVLGLIMSGCALLLSEAGHGTYAPMIANVSVLALIPALGFLLAVVGTPFLWAIYFVLLPEMDSLAGRILALVVVVLLHVVPGIWLATEDPAFTRALESSFQLVLAHGLSLLVAIVCLVLFISRESKRPKDYA
jgi:hypothetical protein